MSFSLMKWFMFLKNQKKVLYFADHIVDEFNQKYLVGVNSKSELLPAIKQELKNNFDEVAYYGSNDDFYEIAMGYVCSVSYDLAAYRISPTNFMNSNLRYLHNEALKWAVKHGIYTEDEANEENQALREDLRMR